MIEAATDILKRRWAETAGVVGVLVFLWSLPVLMVLVGVAGAGVIEQRTTAYEPVVYLDVSVGGGEAKRLSEEISGWSGVERISVRTPAQALSVVGDRIGEEEAAALGLSAEMFGYSLKVEPEGMKLDLIARLAGLEAREGVDAVDVPEGQAMGLLRVVRGGVVSAAVLAVLGWFLSIWLLRAQQARWRWLQREEWQLLMRFGASPRGLARVQWKRAMAVSLAAGGVSSMGLMVMWIAWRSAQAGVVGVAPSEEIEPVVLLAAPFVWSLLAGALAAGLEEREGRRVSREGDELEIEALVEA